MLSYVRCFLYQLRHIGYDKVSDYRSKNLPFRVAAGISGTIF